MVLGRNRRRREIREIIIIIISFQGIGGGATGEVRIFECEQIYLLFRAFLVPIIPEKQKYTLGPRPTSPVNLIVSL